MVAKYLTETYHVDLKYRSTGIDQQCMRFKTVANFKPQEEIS